MNLFSSLFQCYPKMSFLFPCSLPIFSQSFFSLQGICIRRLDEKCIKETRRSSSGLSILEPKNPTWTDHVLHCSILQKQACRQTLTFSTLLAAQQPIRGFVYFSLIGWFCCCLCSPHRMTPFHWKINTQQSTQRLTNYHRYILAIIPI